MRFQEGATGDNRSAGYHEYATRVLFPDFASVTAHRLIRETYARNTIEDFGTSPVAARAGGRTTEERKRSCLIT